MKILVLGGGVLGVTAAYSLHQRGHKVEVIERNAATAMECSFANAGQLSYNHAEPWANPAALRNGLSWLGKKDAPLLFRLQADPRMWLWTLRFVMNCTRPRVRKNTETMLRICLYSRLMMHKLIEETKLDFDYAKDGRLFIFENQKTLENQVRQSEFQCTLGGQEFERLTPEQCVAREPALGYHARRIIGGIFDPEDESGDVHKFTQALAAHLEKQGVVFHYGTKVQRVVQEKRRVIGVETDKGMMNADNYVMALGCYSPIFLRQAGISVPIYPLKGYSISINTKDCKREDAPRVSLTHTAKKLAYSRLGDVLRVGGTAEFAGYDDKVVKHRIDIAKNDTREIFPKGGDIENATEWACLRPMTPDGPPILGRTPVANLFLNTGHGSLGWTQCAGSATIVADVIEGREPEISLKGMDMGRYL